MWCASCLASACAGCTCNLCASALSAISRRSARLAYCGLFAASLVLSFLMRQFATPLLKQIPCTCPPPLPSHISHPLPYLVSNLVLIPLDFKGSPSLIVTACCNWCFFNVVVIGGFGYFTLLIWFGEFSGASQSFCFLMACNSENKLRIHFWDSHVYGTVNLFLLPASCKLKMGEELPQCHSVL